MRSVINYQPGDVIMAATSLAEVAAFGTRKTEIKRITNGGNVSVPRVKRLHDK